MATIIAFANQKGGVGKTTLTVQGAFYLSLILKKKVLVVDMDAQGNSTQTILGRGTPLTCTLTKDLFEPNHKVEMQKSEDGIYVIGSSIDDESGYGTETLDGSTCEYVRDYIWDIAENSDFDYILIDTPPSMGNRLFASLLLADYVVCPIRLSGYAGDGVKRLLRNILGIQTKFNDNLRILGFLVNEFDGSVSQEKAIQKLNEAFEEAGLKNAVFKTRLRHRPPIDQASEGLPIWMARNGRKAAEEIYGVYAEIFSRINAIEKNK